MSEVKLLVGIVVENPTENKLIKGVVKLKCKENIRILSIRGEFNNIVRGNLAASLLKGIDFPISEYSTITSGVDYEFPFSFQIDDLDIVEYKGINAFIMQEITIILRIDAEDVYKIKPNIFSKMISKISSASELQFYKVIDIAPKTCQYRAVEESKKLELTLKQSVIYISIFTTLVIIGSVFYYYQFFDFFALIFSLVFGIILTVFIVGAVLRRMFKTVQVQIHNNHEGLEFNFTTPQLFKLKNPTFYYQVIEKVIDRSGTKTVTRKEVLFQSPDKLIGSGWQKLVQENFPDKNGIQTMDINDLEVYWELNLRAYWMGLPFIFEAPFTVECK